MIVGRKRALGWAALSLLVACLGCAPSRARADGLLHFARDGKVVGQTDLDTLRAHCGVERVRVDDPYYRGLKQFLACPLGPILVEGFALSAAVLAERDFFLHALDGYVKPAAGVQLMAEGGYLAFADAERTDAGADPFMPVWEPIDRKQVDPGPYYMVWANVERAEAEAWPWPYQLARIEIASVERQYPRTVPAGVAPDSAASEGYALFGKQCISCHAMNGQGGRVGPDLNVPRSIVEYRPRDQIVAFIRNPELFRYSSMPPHLHLSDSQLDAIVAYFKVMSHQKFDPGSAGARRGSVDGASGGEE